VNHPALIKTSDQPSFSSANFSPFTSAEALRSSDISPVTKPEPKAKSSWWNSKENNEYKKFVEATQKKNKIK